MNQSKFNKLIKKYQQGKLNRNAEKVMNTWFNALASKADSWSSSEVEDLKKSIFEQIAQDQPRPRPIFYATKWRAIAAAAMLLLVSAIGLYMYNDMGSHPTKEVMVNNPAPGGNNASLTLADGREFSLREDQDGIIVQDHSVVYRDGSDLGNLNSAVEGKLDQQQSAMLRTPRSGQYQITLSDGSKVWLNSDSKLTYPISFDHEQRTVKLEGEAYFEIKSQLDPDSRKKVPFLVLMNGQQVEVLGTEFNISGYSDEDHFTTTLVKGSVKVSRADGDRSPVNPPSIILTPGQQSILKDGQFTVQAMDVNEAIAWKNGNFMFNDEAIESVMRKLARWYDVEVIYQGDMEDIHIWGSVSRSEHIAEVLKVIELTELVKFKVIGRRVYVVRI